jgi:quinol monooxygenase YgiN
MNLKQFFVLGAAGLLPLFAWPAIAQDRQGVVVRIAELEIEPAQMEAYSAAVKEEMEISVRDEPGVLAIYAVSIKGKPHHLRFFEIYANEAAYLAHRDSPHFKKYVATTQHMIKARTLYETDNFLLSAKPNLKTP